MKSIDKSKLLDSLQNQVELQLQEVVKTFQNLDDNTLLEPGAGGGWSIAQCLEHLNRYGRYYLPQIKKGLDSYNGTSCDTFKSTWFGNYFTKMMDPQTGKRKLKAFKNYIPSRNINAHAVVAEFIDQQELLLSYIQQARQADLNTIRIPVSILKFVRMKLGDVFQFVIAHNQRHVLQARRVIELVEN